MADLSELSASQSVKIAGANASGLETNFVDATVNGLKVDLTLVTASDGSAPSTNALVVGGVTAAGTFQTFETNASGHLNIADGGGSITVDATSLPLPTGAATETTLAALNGKFNSLGQKTSANSVPVVIASDQAISVASGLALNRTFVVNTGPITGATAVGTKSLAYLFHPLSQLGTYRLVSVIVDQTSGNGSNGSQRIELRKITAEAVTPGGTSGSIAAKEGSDTSLATFRYNVTSAPTRSAPVLFSCNVDPKVNAQIYAVGTNGAEGVEIKPWTMTKLLDEGYEITQVVSTALSSAPVFNITFEWTEE